MKKIIPVSLLAIWVACPAFAENFPNDGYMLENKTYDNAATYENMGVYEDYVDAIAEYDDCPANSYCDSSGQHSCPSGYPYSAVGAGASTECYKACTTENVPHSTAVTGNDYNGGVDTCTPTSCVAGYHTDFATLGSIIGNASIQSADYNDGAVDTGYSVDYGSHGVVSGHAQCSTLNGMGVGHEASLPDFSGPYCWCNVDGYTPAGGTKQNVSSSWVGGALANGEDPVSWCEFECPETCAIFFDISNFSDVQVGNPACEANTITINWSDVDDDGDATTMSTDVLYDGDVVTPVKAATYPGKTFIGWRFVAPEEEGGGW